MPEENIQNDELEPKKNSRKDMWLFFIFIDIIVLCVLGYFIYATFFDGINVRVNEDFTPEPFLEEVFVSDIKTDIKTATPAPAPAPAVAAPEPAKPKPAPVVEQPQEQKAKRESVVVSGAGKTRTVTFKYFGNAKTAAVVGGFTMRKPVAMKKVGDVWQATLIIYPGEYRYKYIIDGKEIPDPEVKEDDGRSVLIVK